MEDTTKLELLKERIPYNANKYNSKDAYTKNLQKLLDDSKYIALSTLYPFKNNLDSIELPTKYDNWQLRACQELYKWARNSGAKSYSESSFSWNRGNDGPLSNALLEELSPKAGAPERRIIDDN